MKRSPKVGVLTFHRCINYGSYWQARCAVEGLKARGCEAVLLDHRSARVNWAEWRCALDPQLPRRSSAADRALHAEKTRKFFLAFNALPQSAPFALEAPEAMEPMDVVVVGSDEVWNFRHPWYAGYPLFFGEGLQTDRLVAYAASFGSHDAAEALEPRWAERLNRFDALSVRDDNSRRLLQGALGRDPALVLDPCLQFASVCRREPRTEAKDIVVYGHSFPESFALAVRAWTARAGLRLVSLGYRNDWADQQRLSLGPEEFAQAMANAAAVVTNFFHGCVFALVNAKAFICTASSYRSNKIRALTQAVGAEDRLLGPEPPDAAIESLLSRPLPSSISEAIGELRRGSDAYLDHALA